MEEEKREKKMRFLKSNKGIEKYLSSCKAVEAMKIRLNMVTWIEDNVGAKGVCPLCAEEDTTEHVFWWAVPNNQGVNVAGLEKGETMEEIVKLFEETQERRREHWLENIEEKFYLWRREGTLWDWVTYMSCTLIYT